MPVYNAGRGKWLVRVFHRGRQHNRTLYGSKRDAEDFEAKLRAELRAGEVSELRRVPTFDEFSTTRYAVHAALHLKPATLNQRKYRLAALSEYFGHLQLNRIGIAEVDAYKSARLQLGHKPSSINSGLTLLETILNFARELGINVPKRKWKKLKERGRRAVRAWSPKDLENLFEKVHEICPHILRHVLILANTGMRKGELLAMRWEWVHLDADPPYLRVEASGEDDGDEWSPKTERYRDVPINGTLREILSRPTLSSTWVAPSERTGDRYQYWPQNSFDRARDAAGLRGGPHTLRHSYATELILRTNGDLYLASRILGHSMQRTTELYGHLVPDHLRRAARAVDFAPAAKLDLSLDQTTTQEGGEDA